MCPRKYISEAEADTQTTKGRRFNTQKKTDAVDKETMPTQFHREADGTVYIMALFCHNVELGFASSGVLNFVFRNLCATVESIHMPDMKN